MRFVPYHELGDLPNIVVDGSPNRFTELVLSHWPGNKTPSHLKADLSAQIAFNYLDDVESQIECDVVSNNHFDEDGLVSLFSLIYPEEAQSMRELLVDIARAGDFSCFDDRDAARVSFVLSAWSDPDRSPLSRAMFAGSSEDLTKVLYEELLPRFSALIDKINHFGHLWMEDDRCLSVSEDAIASGVVSIDIDNELDLAIVSLPDGGILGENDSAASAKSWVSSVCHPMAIHNATDCNRILVMLGRRYEVYFRYESWIELISKNVLPRADLAAFASSLNRSDRRAVKWQFNGVGAIISRLALSRGSESKFSPNEFTAMLREELRRADDGASKLD